MILPTHLIAAGSATTPATTFQLANPVKISPTSSLPDYGSENWSSLIGIITAIVGNVLISFALNMQRYAHIRLEREWQEKERQRKRRLINNGSSHTEGQDEVERTHVQIGKQYHPPRHTEYTVDDERAADLNEGGVATEADPLLGPVRPSRVDEQAVSRKAGPTGSGGEHEAAYKQKSYLKSPYWWAGIILMTTGEAGNFLAYGFAPASIVSPLGVVALISNCIIAPIMLKEPFRKRDGLGVLVAVAGAVTVVASASDNNPKLGPDEIWDLITTWEFETYLGITIAVIVVLTVASNRFGEKSILIDLGLVGLFGGYTALSTKGVASMLSYTLWRAITFPVTYLLAAVLIGTAVMQIKYVNRALQRFDATQVIPVQFVMFTLSVILGSAILYRDFERTSGDDAGKFVGGCAMTFLGVWLITSGRSSRRDEDDENREPEGEDSINLLYQDDADAIHDNDTNDTRRSSTVRGSSPPPDSAKAQKKHPTMRNAFARNYSFQHQATKKPPSEGPSPMTPYKQPGPETSEFPFATQPPTPISRHSTPLLPSEATNTTPGTSTSNPELASSLVPPRTPTRGTSDNFLSTTPSTVSNVPPHLRRSIASVRNSTAIPGPLLTSPLSNSLSAMVADLKRGGSLRALPVNRANSTARRRESVLGIGASEVDEEAMLEGETLDRRRTATDDVPSQNRQRSLSGTLGEMWRGVRGSFGDGERQGHDGNIGEEEGLERR